MTLSLKNNGTAERPLAGLEQKAVEEYCCILRMPTVAATSARFAQEAARTNQTHVSFLAALLEPEVEERERGTIDRRLKEARLPRLKTLKEFDFAANPQLSPTLLRQLSEGGCLERAEPVIFIGDSGTGKTHLATGLYVAACQQKKRVRFDAAADLVNELVEAQHHNLLGRALGNWSRYDFIVLDEVGYVPFAQIGAELLFQVISERAERATIIVTTNLPFSE